MPEPLDDTALLVRAAEEAGAIAMKHYRTDVRTYEKPDNQGPVTVADLEVNDMLVSRFAEDRPDYAILSEEAEDDGRRLAASHVIIIDPIDGTRAFIAGEPGFSISIGIAVGGRLTAAAVHLPARGETFAASVGGGALKNGVPIAATDPEATADATVLAARVQMQPERWSGGVPPMTRHFRSSLAWRMCLVAEGRFDSMVTFRRAFEWDIAAGTLIATEAGARVTDGDGAGMIFNSVDGMQAGVVAAGPSLHQQIMHHRNGPVPAH